MLRRTRILGICAALVFAGARLFAYEVKDIDGRVFSFEHAPQIASITPSVSETVFELGMADYLLGVSRYCDYPEALNAKTKLGGFVDPDYEKIVTLKPELIILPKTSDATVRERFGRLGISVFLIHPDGLENVSKNVLLVGKIFQKELEARKIADEIEREIAPVKSGSKTKALFLFGKMAAGKNSFAGDLLERAGFENIADKAGAPWPVLSREFILTNPPEAIILEIKKGESENAMRKSLQNDRLWARTPALKNGRIYFIDSQTVIVPGPRIVKAAKRLKEIAAETSAMKKKNP